MPHFRVTRTDGPSDDGPSTVINDVHLEILAYRRAGKRLLLAADLLEAELARKGVASTEEAQAEAVVRALVDAIKLREESADALVRELADVLSGSVN